MPHSPTSGRLIVDSPKPGITNMSIDQALLESTAATGEPILRFYRWSPATLSLGYFQKLESRTEHAASSPCPIVRRASGGGAIVHDNELTYSLCVASRGSIAKANRDLYDTVHHAIRKSLAEQNISVSLYEQPSGQFVKASTTDPFLCFQRRAIGDLICNDHKIGGSAQRRLKNALIQHGSLLLSESQFAPELPGLQEINAAAVDVDELMARINVHLQDSMSLTFSQSQLTELEVARTEAIEVEKFGAENWLMKR